MPLPSYCSKCRRRVTWVRMADSGKRMPVDPAVNTGGNVAAYRDGTGAWVGYVLTKDASPLPHERRYMPHFATCAAKEPASLPEPLPANVLPFTRRRTANGRA